jgi:Lipase maturation factor
MTHMPDRPTYWLTRFLILRLLGIVYAVAFLVAINQILPLIGSDGLTPVDVFIQRVTAALGSTGAAFIRLPSLFWLTHSDTALLTVAWIGLILSLAVTAGFANAPILAILWFLYMSICNIGQEWYGYGWEIQLLETGFLAIFLCPLIDPRPFPKREPPLLVIILFRWLICRIMFGAGLIKLRGDEVWRNGTALFYHFETQPMPGPLSRWFHFLPHPVLKIGVWYNWLAELIAPLFVFGPRITRHIAGIIIVVLQIILILSGNLSFLNWLTIIPAIACFDDQLLTRLLPCALTRKATQAMAAAQPSRPMTVTAWTVTVIIGLLSIQPVLNMLSPNQIMNSSFDPFNLVNTYGAFGSVGLERYNIVFEGTTDDIPTDSATWRAYSYKGLPVDPDDRPPQVAPYHLRFDWQMWFAAMSTPDDYPWTLTLISKLLRNNPTALRLFASNPFPRKPPRYIRAILYRYSFAPSSPAKAPAKAGNLHPSPYWIRERIGAPWLPAMSADDPRLKP